MSRNDVSYFSSCICDRGAPLLLKLTTRELLGVATRVFADFNIPIDIPPEVRALMSAISTQDSPLSAKDARDFWVRRRRLLVSEPAGTNGSEPGRGIFTKAGGAGPVDTWLMEMTGFKDNSAVPSSTLTGGNPSCVETNGVSPKYCVARRALSLESGQGNNAVDVSVPDDIAVVPRLLNLLVTMSVNLCLIFRLSSSNALQLIA